MASPGWLHITADGLAAGAAAAAATHMLVSWTATVAAASTGFLVDAGGALAATATRYFFGDVSAMTVRVLGRMGSTSSEAGVQRSGAAVALASAALVGGTTALTVTVGSRLVKATVHYGGNLTREAAQCITEAYLKYRADQTAESVAMAYNEEEENWTTLEYVEPSKNETDADASLDSNALCHDNDSRRDRDALGLCKSDG